MTWTIDEIAAEGGSGVVSVVVRVMSAGNLTNIAFANSTENKTVVNKTSDNVTVIPNVELSMDKRANVTKAVVGDKVEFSITVTNGGFLGYFA